MVLENALKKEVDPSVICEQDFISKDEPCCLKNIYLSLIYSRGTRLALTIRSDALTIRSRH
jgi:hypothetical protein